MKPVSFDYLAAQSWDEAVAMLGRHGEDAKLLAGGQSLVPAMNFRLARPSVLIDLNTIDEGSYVDREGENLTIGALTRHVRFETPACGGPLGRLIPRICRHVAHPPIRMRGTFAGSLAHADPSSEWCALTATLEGTVVAVGPTGDRMIAARDYFVAALTTALDASEAIREIRLPVLTDDWGCGFREYSRRAGDFAMGLVIACLRMKDGIVVDARIGIGGVRDTPFRATDAEAALIGQPPSETSFEQAGEAAAEIDDALEDHHATAEYRRDLVRALVPRALADAVADFKAAAS